MCLSEVKNKVTSQLLSVLMKIPENREEMMGLMGEMGVIWARPYKHVSLDYAWC